MAERLLVLGHTGFLGRHVTSVANNYGWLTSGASLSSGFDFRKSGSLERAVKEFSPSVIINCAAHVGGIAYSKPRQATIFSDNVQMILEFLNFLQRKSKYPYGKPNRKLCISRYLSGVS